MTLDASKARVAVTGAVSSGLTSATAPTGTGGTITGFNDLGYITEDGVTLSMPGSGDVQKIKAWQNGATVRTIRTPSEDNPTYHFTLMETKLETIELYFGTTVTQSVTDGSFSIDNSTTRPYKSYVIDVIDGAELERVYIPKGVVTEVGDRVYKGDEVIGYEVTIEAERDATKGYNAKVWATALKS